MNPDKYFHAVSVARRATTIASQVPTGAVSSPFASVSCLLEPMTAKERDTEIARLSQAQYKMTWGDEALASGDILTVLSTNTTPARWVGRKFILAEPLDDSLRPDKPYQVALLKEAKF